MSTGRTYDALAAAAAAAAAPGRASSLELSTRVKYYYSAAKNCLFVQTIVSGRDSSQSNKCDNLILLLDTSSSMSVAVSGSMDLATTETKLDALKHGVKLLLRKLNENGHQSMVSLVAFNSVVTNIISNTHVKNQTLPELVDALAVEQSTNIEAAFNSIKPESLVKGAINYICLFTDGEATEGSVHKEGILRRIKQLSDRTQCKIIIIPFGIGADYNMSLLKSMGDDYGLPCMLHNTGSKTDMETTVGVLMKLFGSWLEAGVEVRLQINSNDINLIFKQIPLHLESAQFARLDNFSNERGIKVVHKTVMSDHVINASPEMYLHPEACNDYSVLTGYYLNELGQCEFLADMESLQADFLAMVAADRAAEANRDVVACKRAFVKLIEARKAGDVNTQRQVYAAAGYSSQLSINAGIFMPTPPPSPPAYVDDGLSRQKRVKK